MTTKTLLIVDDSTTSRLLIKAMFAEIQPEWNYLQAAGGDEALNILQSTPVDYFSIDYNMPGLSGLELIEEVRKTHPQSPIVLLTANIQPQIEEKSKLFNSLCIHKPLTDDTIKQAEEHFSHE
ncbi:MAG: response regulator [Gammaproteobacteria bacterium]|nr:response regulator [Gammaproteobacteria bacterium]